MDKHQHQPRFILFNFQQRIMNHALTWLAKTCQSLERIKDWHNILGHIVPLDSIMIQTIDYIYTLRCKTIKILLEFPLGSQEVLRP